VKIRVENVPPGMYALELYKVGYRCNDAYSTYLSMGRPAQLSGRQVEEIKSLNNGAPVLKEVVGIRNGIPFSKDIEIRENDVFLMSLIKL
jgi:xylan 1,4-beta-xylosidase